VKEKDKVFHRSGKQIVVNGEILDNWTKSQVAKFLQDVRRVMKALLN
jgi:hypothetical protein